MTHDRQIALQNRRLRNHFSMQDFLYKHSSTEHARLNPAYVGLHVKHHRPRGREHTWSIRRGCVRLFGCGACLDVPMFGSAIPIGSLVVITL